jgi:hypothetical protein
VDAQKGVSEEDCGGLVVEKSAVIRDGLEDLAPQEIARQVPGWTWCWSSMAVVHDGIEGYWVPYSIEIVCQASGWGW